MPPLEGPLEWVLEWLARREARADLEECGGGGGGGERALFDALASIPALRGSVAARAYQVNVLLGDVVSAATNVRRPAAQPRAAPPLAGGL